MDLTLGALGAVAQLPKDRQDRRVPHGIAGLHAVQSNSMDLLLDIQDLPLDHSTLDAPFLDSFTVFT